MQRTSNRSEQKPAMMETQEQHNETSPTGAHTNQEAELKPALENARYADLWPAAFRLTALWITSWACSQKNLTHPVAKHAGTRKHAVEVHEHGRGLALRCRAVLGLQGLLQERPPRFAV